jgi:hypothetical protein
MRASGPVELALDALAAVTDPDTRGADMRAAHFKILVNLWDEGYSEGYDRGFDHGAIFTRDVAPIRESPLHEPTRSITSETP